MNENEPQIVAYCCQYCAYAAADLAGSMRLNYPTNVKIVRIPCTGKVDELYLLKAVESGADGVLVIGCEEGDCHFINGNIWAKKRVNYTKQLLTEIGLNPERVAMYNLSAAKGRKIAQIFQEFTDKIRQLN